jgi:hypothetical protein
MATTGLGAGLLVTNLVSRDQLVFGQTVDLSDQGFIFGRSFPVPHGLARVAHTLSGAPDLV